MDDWSNIPPSPRQDTLPDEIEHIKGIVGKYFPIYEVRVQFNTISYFCNIDPELLESQFEALRKEMKGENFIPILKYEGGEYIVHVVRQPRMKFRSITLNLILLIATIITTIMAGAVLWHGTMSDGLIESTGFWDPFTFTNLLLGGLFFALPLMTILGVHEMAHYYAAKRHGIAVSLPFFIPIPPFYVVPIGTMGAFISIREPIPNKKALLDIGIAGPIAGFLVAIPVTIIGLLLSSPLEVVTQTGIIEGGTTFVGESIFFSSLRYFLPLPDNIQLHPMAFAGWVGLFVTALNLLPAGQLDGGHVASALLGNKSRYASYGAFILMLILGLWFTGWLIFAMLIMFLGLRHPPPLNDVTKLDDKRKMLGIATAIILVLCFVPIPFSVETVDYDIDFDIVLSDGSLTATQAITEYVSDTTWLNRTETLRLHNNGNVVARITLFASSSNANLTNVSLRPESEMANASASHTFDLNPLEMVNLTLDMNTPPNTVGNVTLTVSATYAYRNTQLTSQDINELGLNTEVQIFMELRELP